MNNPLSSAAALMGAKGGRAGKGKAKVRRTSFSSSNQPARAAKAEKSRDVAPGRPISTQP